MGFLPINRREMQRLGWEQPDFVYVTGDAYVDHPSFGHAIISRILESHGYKVAILPQPDWRDDNAIHEFGKPRLGFLVSSGNMDSMVNHYSVSKKRRQMDAYTPGGVIGKRPDYADVVYGNYIRRNFPDSPIILGGIEASLRRLAHYDYWSDKLKRSILIGAQADIISYGMGEHSIVEIADALNSGLPVSELTFIRGTVCKVRSLDRVPDALVLPTYDELTKDKKQYAASFYKQYCNTDPFTAKQLAEPYGSHLYVIQNPPAYPLTTQEMDDVYELPYMRTYHPSYEALGGVPAISEIKFSLCSNRGCFGGCSFCALTFHQGRIIQTRSHESLIREAKLMTQEKDFKGYIHDVGGPTANFRHPACQKQLTKGVCTGKQCLFPSPCKNLTVDHQDYIQLLRKLRALPKVKKVFIRSGIRFDYVLADKSDAFLKELCQYHVSGQLKVAPEHVSDRVLKYMGKPENAVYKRFTQRYKAMNEKLGLKQYLVPYLMSSHPGSQLTDAVEMAEHLRDLGYMPEQVQDFYPTPSTISTCMYYTGLDPRTMKKVYVTNNPHEKAMQRALIQYRNPKNYDLVYEALHRAHRTDLIGFGPKCLIRPKPNGHPGSDSGYRGQTNGRSNNSNRGKGSYKGQNNNPKDNSAKGNNRSQTGARPENGASTARPKKKKSIRNVHKKKQK